MSGYTPLYVRGMETGLVQSRQEFILPNDAYPTLENAYVWRERIKRRQGLTTLGRLRRIFTSASLGNASGGGSFSGNLNTKFTLEASSDIQVGSVVVSDGTNIFTDNGLGVLVGVPSGSGTINYATGAITITGATGGAALTISFNYYPNLPVMGIRIRELNTINLEQTVVWDTVYAYIFLNGGWQEFIPGTTWTGLDSNFFWTTNYWVSNANAKIFWATNFSGPSGDPIRYTDGSVWVNFAPVIDVTGNKLNQCLALLPFRGRLVAFNTWEGLNLGGSLNFPNRIRWSEIGNPFDTVSAIVTTVVSTAWRDDIRGKGGFLNIPTSESIVSVGFVRDNLVIYCERSTWQLRYTGRSIAPFQIEKVNSELGAESTFSAVQFDTSLVGIGDKGVVECDSYKSERIDLKIPDLVFEFSNSNSGTQRVYGIRDFQQKLAYWIYPYEPIQTPEVNDIYPNRRLVYNYENDSWAIFTDSLTALGTFQPLDSPAWQDFTETPTDTWAASDFPWVTFQEDFPAIVGGNQQGFVMYLSSNLQASTTNAVTLTISNITFSTYTLITSPNHNLFDDQVIQILNIPAGTPYATSLNGNIFSVVVVDYNTFQIWSYDADNGLFDIPVTFSEGTYIGGGSIAVRDGFSITSKKFNFLEDGQNIQLGYIDILMDTTESGAITLNTYIDYNDSTPINQTGQNNLPDTNPPQPDTFFNSIVPTYDETNSTLDSDKLWHRVICPTRGAFITIEWTLSNAQLIGVEQESNVQVDSQILYLRRAGRQLPLGV
jgi:hypothetical protein